MRTIYATGLFVIISFIVKGYIRPKGRPRFGKNGNVYTPPETVAAETNIAWHAKLAMKGREPFEGPCKVRIELMVASVSRKKMGQHAISRGDIENISKGCCDAMNTIVYFDDRQITELHISRIFGTETMARITVQKLT